MPRAAMSVATSTRPAPVRKRSSAPVRALCDLLPWIASAGTPSWASCRDPVGAVLGAREDERAADRLVLEHPAEQGTLGRLSTNSTRCSTRSTVDATGLASTLTGSFRMLRASRTTSGSMVAEQRLTPLRQRRNHFADVMDKAHVEHAVGLVEHEDLEAIEPHQALAHQVEQTARRRDQDVDSARQRLHLLALAHAAEHDSTAELSTGHRWRSCRGSGPPARASG